MSPDADPTEQNHSFQLTLAARVGDGEAGILEAPLDLEGLVAGVPDALLVVVLVLFVPGPGTLENQLGAAHGDHR